jgi:hypothetical protein
MENVGVQVRTQKTLAPRGKHWRASVHGKLWHRAEDYYVHMHALNLSLRDEHTHSNVHMGCASIS